jgi:spermidine/putrescine transport system permease protein
MAALAGDRALSDGARRRRPAFFALFWGAPMLLWQLAFFLAPLLFLVWMSFWQVRNFRLTPAFILKNWQALLGARYLYEAYSYTLTMAAAGALLAAAAAFPAAYALAFRASPAMRRHALFLLITPFFTSYLVRVYAWEIFLSDRGVINYLLGFVGVAPLPLLASPLGTIIGYLTLTLPLVMLIQLFALGAVDRRLVEAAHNLGCGRLRTVFTVVVPAARVGLVLSVAFAFILCFGDFVSPALLGGGKPPTLSILIADQVKSGNNWPRASVVALIMVATLIVALFGAMRLAYRRRGGR